MASVSGPQDFLDRFFNLWTPGHVPIYRVLQPQTFSQMRLMSPMVSGEVLCVKDLPTYQWLAMKRVGSCQPQGLVQGHVIFSWLHPTSSMLRPGGGPGFRMFHGTPPSHPLSRSPCTRTVAVMRLQTAGPGAYPTHCAEHLRSRSNSKTGTEAQLFGMLFMTARRPRAPLLFQSRSGSGGHADIQSRL